MVGGVGGLVLSAGTDAVKVDLAHWCKKASSESRSCSEVVMRIIRGEDQKGGPLF